MPHKRRRFLGLLGATVVGGLAGCAGGGTTARSPSTTATPTATPSPTASAAGTQSAGGGSTPEATVQQYFESIDAGNWGAANALVATTSSPAYVTEEEQSAFEVTIETIENPSLRDVLRDTRDVTGDELDSRVEEAEQTIEDFLAEREYTDHTFVYYSVMLGEDRNSGYFRLVKEDGRWYILGVGTS